MPILYKSTTLVSLKRLTILFLLFVQVVNMSFGSVSGNFGSAIISGNSNQNIRGEGNQGVIESNSNLNLYCVNCVLNIVQTSNALINAENSNLQMYLCPHLLLYGKENTVVLSDNSNSVLKGNNNHWEARSNSNLHISGSGSNLKIIRNQNSKFIGNRCNVVAEDNSNLNVLGDDIKVTVRGTSNHVVTPSTRSTRSAEIGSVNRLQISPSFGANKRSVRSTSNGNSDNFIVDFVDEVVIDQNNYKLGLFVFTVKGSSATGYEVKMNESGVDVGSLAVDTIGHSEVVLSGTKQGVKHQLKVQGHSVKSKDGHEKTFHVKPMQTSM